MFLAFSSLWLHFNPFPSWATSSAASRNRLRRCLASSRLRAGSSERAQTALSPSTTLRCRSRSRSTPSWTRCRLSHSSPAFARKLRLRPPPRRKRSLSSPQGEALVQVEMLSVDAFLRTMLDEKAYHGAISLGDTLPALGYGRVIASASPKAKSLPPLSASLPPCLPASAASPPLHSSPLLSPTRSLVLSHSLPLTSSPLVRPDPARLARDGHARRPRCATQIRVVRLALERRRTPLYSAVITARVVTAASSLWSVHAGSARARSPS